MSVTSVHRSEVLLVAENACQKVVWAPISLTDNLSINRTWLCHVDVRRLCDQQKSSYPY
ncbi:hypothetical protein PSAC2689_50412 [Paraburkholderia sacchari]